MSARYLLDSTIFIDHLKGTKAAIDWVSGLHIGEGALSVVTRAEVLSKAGDEWERTAAFLDEYACIGINADDADIAAGLRAKYRIKLPDAFQAALAMNNDLTLITRDEADFKKITDLDVKIPYKI